MHLHQNIHICRYMSTRPRMHKWCAIDPNTLQWKQIDRIAPNKKHRTIKNYQTTTQFPADPKETQNHRRFSTRGSDGDPGGGHCIQRSPQFVENSCTPDHMAIYIQFIGTRSESSHHNGFRDTPFFCRFFFLFLDYKEILWWLNVDGVKINTVSKKQHINWLPKDKHRICQLTAVKSSLELEPTVTQNSAMLSSGTQQCLSLCHSCDAVTQISNNTWNI